MFTNIPKAKVGIVAVSRDCFPASLAINRRKALIDAYTAKYDADDIYECPVCIIESETQMVEALEDVKKAGCNALVVYLENRVPGDAAEAQMVRSQIRDELSQASAYEFGTAWNKWNLSRMDLKASSGASIEEYADDGEVPEN